MSAAAVTRSMIDTVQMPRIDSKASLVRGLQFMHGLMRASVPLLRVAIEKSSGALRDYYRNELNEERDHAAWLAEDLTLLGARLPVVDHAAAATAGAQYYYLDHVGPHALLGYIAALEFRPMPMADVEALEKHFGAPALRTVRHHAEHDPNHANVLAGVIDQHSEFVSIISYSAFVTAKMVAFYLTERMNEGGV